MPLCLSCRANADGCEGVPEHAEPIEPGEVCDRCGTEGPRMAAPAPGSAGKRDVPIPMGPGQAAGIVVGILGAMAFLVFALAEAAPC